MQYVLLVSIGGALGATARHGINQLMAAKFGSSLLGTMIANISGSFALGLFVGLLASQADWSGETRAFIAIGFLGSYTTFSTLSVETVQMLQQGDFSTASLNLGGSILFGILAALAGLLVGKLV